ncbi:hypothetical protein KFK09_028371 [Dendrobium nobile]|uniref:tRNA (guanine(46)-N(7))-methyltransferase n=1 Tax=Dendrobium nobile TaxID=94219 RepID=A0A8T3A1E4_DENNO|nr:hypothetical protein KFK09_028371 [Dendrobium nobile]
MLVQESYIALFKLVNGMKAQVPFSEWSNEDKDLAQFNAKCLNYFFCALKYEDYMKVYTCAASKEEILDRLCITYEETSEEVMAIQVPCKEGERIDIPLEEGEFVSMEHDSPISKCIEELVVRNHDTIEDDGMFMEDECPQQTIQREHPRGSKTLSTSYYNSDALTDTEDMHIAAKCFAMDDNDFSFSKVHSKRVFLGLLVNKWQSLLHPDNSVFGMRRLWFKLKKLKQDLKGWNNHIMDHSFILTLISHEENDTLCRPLSFEEVKETLFNINSNSVAGPDGLSLEGDPTTSRANIIYWTKPPKNFFKLNVDGACYDSSVEYGGNIRDSNGFLILAFAGPVHLGNYSTAITLVILYAVVWMDIDLSCDCTNNVAESFPIGALLPSGCCSRFLGTKALQIALVTDLIIFPLEEVDCRKVRTGHPTPREQSMLARGCSSAAGRTPLSAATMDAKFSSQVLRNFSRRMKRRFVIPRKVHRCYKPCSSAFDSNGTRNGGITSSDIVEREYADLNLKELYGAGQIGHVRIRQHVNPLGSSFSVPVEVPDWDDVFNNSKLPLMVDIGSGSGRLLIWLAKRFPESRNYLGLEIRHKLIQRCQFWSKEISLRNIHFLSCNATISFERLVSSYPGPLVFVTILCPDPHFKKRHHKRRVLQKPLVDSILNNLITGGQVCRC